MLSRHTTLIFRTSFRS